MNVRRRTNRFCPSLDILPSRISPTVYTTIDLVSMGSGDSMTSQTDTTPTVQAMPTDASEMVGPSY